MTVTPLHPVPDHPADHLMTFLREQCDGKSDATWNLYEQVISRLLEFMEDVDVTPVYGPEIARYLNEQRNIVVNGGNTHYPFLPALGYAGLVRALPLFLTEPWLPPAGANRRAHRALVERLLVFLRRQGLIDSATVRHDLKAARRAIGTARSRDYSWRASVDDVDEGGTSVVTLDLELPNAVLDELLAELERREDGTLAGLVAQWLTPPGYDEPEAWGRWPVGW